MAYQLNPAWVQTDLREVLAAVRVPTLVLHRGLRGREEAHDVARRIVGSRTTGLAGDDWWGIFLSPEVVEEVERFVAGQDPPQVPDSVLATLLLTDIVGSTTRAAELGSRVGGRCWDGITISSVANWRGSGGRSGIPLAMASSPRSTGRQEPSGCAQVMVQRVRELGLEFARACMPASALHDGKVAGIAVSIAARVAGQASAGEVLVTGTVKDLVAGSGLTFDPRGEHELKGVPGDWPIYLVRTE